MALNGYVQVAPDSTGKLVDMQSDTGVDPGDAVTRPAAGTAVYRQRAVIVGDALVALQQLVEINTKQVQLLLEIVTQLNATSNLKLSVNLDDYQ